MVRVRLGARLGVCVGVGTRVRLGVWLSLDMVVWVGVRPIVAEVVLP